jgi:hypothetical protein
LKQLKVAISTGQVCQMDQVHKIRKQILSTCVTTVKVFKKLSNIPPKGVLDRNARTASFLNMPSSFHAKRQGGGG